MGTLFLQNKQGKIEMDNNTGTTTYYTYFMNEDLEMITPAFIDLLDDRYDGFTEVVDTDGGVLGWVFEAGDNAMSVASEFRAVIPDRVAVSGEDTCGVSWFTPIPLDTDFSNERRNGWVPESVRERMLRVQELMN